MKKYIYFFFFWSKEGNTDCQKCLLKLGANPWKRVGDADGSLRLSKGVIPLGFSRKQSLSSLLLICGSRNGAVLCQQKYSSPLTLVHAYCYTRRTDRCDTGERHS